MKKVIIGSTVVIASLAGLLLWTVAGNNKVKADTQAYQALLDKIYGTTLDRHRGERLLHHRIQDVIKTCMEGRGLSYTPPTYGGSSAGVVSPGDLDIATPLSDTFGIADRHRAHAQGIEADHTSGGDTLGQTPETMAAYGAAGNECINKAMPLEDDYHPKEQPEVVDKFLVELRKVQTGEAAKPFLTEYQGCLQKAGYEAKSRFELYDHVLKQFPIAGEPWSAVEATDQWKNAVVAEQKAAATDKTCRAKLYNWAVGEMRPLVDQFNADPQVDAVTKGWANIEAGYKAAGL